MDSRPDLSVVTVNYNGFGDTCRLVESLRGRLPAGSEIIVVDNGSRRDEAALLAARYPEITALRSEANLGFAGGNNLGIRRSRGRYVLLLNNDALVEDDSLKYLVERLENDPRLGAVSPKIVYAAEPGRIQFAGYTPLGRITLRNRTYGYGEPDDGRFDVPGITAYIHGAAVMFRREAFDTAGPMPECYFLYYEELDWSERMRERGYAFGYEPRCRVLHAESRSTGADSPLKTYYLVRNRLLFARRNRRGGERWLSLLYQTAVAVPKTALSYALRGRWDSVRAALRGVMDFYRGRTGKMDTKRQE